MQLSWKITDHDISKVKNFVDGYKNNAFVEHRIRKNIQGSRPVSSRESFWHHLMACLLTSQ